MNNTKTLLEGVPFIDSYRLWESINDIPVEDRIRTLLEGAGVSFFDAERRFVKAPAVGITGIGGLPVVVRDDGKPAFLNRTNSPLDLNDIRAGFSGMMGFGGFITYLNPRNATPENLVAKMHELGHFSTAHTCYVNILIAGISTAVENEFNSQRDLIHLARFTEARTGAQASPSIVVLFPEHLDFYKKVYKTAVDSMPSGETSLSKLDAEEGKNLAFPAAKATLFLASATLRNFQKLVNTLPDMGKENEYKRVVAEIADALHAVVPDVVRSSSDLGYERPAHLK